MFCCELCKILTGHMGGGGKSPYRLGIAAGGRLCVSRVKMILKTPQKNYYKKKLL